MTGIIALLNDSYRELRAKRLFWVVLAISGIIVVGFGSIGFHETGFSILYGLKSYDNDILRDGPFAQIFMQQIFGDFLVKVWLTWGAVILAVISTAGIFPDFLSQGAIDLVLSKPISRTTVFLTKYIGGLLFVFFQVLVFCVGAFFVLGFRADSWDPKVFMAIPVVVAMFSYLFGVTTLAAVVTRSTLASLTVTILFWFLLFIVQTSDAALYQSHLSMQRQIEHDRVAVENALDRAAKSKRAGRDEWSERFIEKASDYRKGIEQREQTLELVNEWQGRTQLVMSFLPKTALTADLMTKWLIEDPDQRMQQVFARQFAGEIETPEEESLEDEESLEKALNERSKRVREVDVESDVVQYYWSKSTFGIVGSSLLFEGVLLAIATFLFTRRDF